MKEKLVFHEVMIDWWKSILDLVAFLAINLYFVFILNRLLIALFLLPLIGIIRLYYSPRCIISQKSAALYRGKRTVRQLEKIIAAGILSQPGEQPYIFFCGVEDMKEKFDLSIVAANVSTGSNHTSRRLDWISLMAANEPWYGKDIPTLFISFCNPYHMVDVPFMDCFINAYSSSEFAVEAVVEKLMGRSAFTGKNPVDPYCGGACRIVWEN